MSQIATFDTMLASTELVITIIAFQCRYEGLTNNGKLDSHGVLKFPSRDRCGGHAALLLPPLGCLSLRLHASISDRTTDMGLLVHTADMKDSLKAARWMAMESMFGQMAREWSRFVCACGRNDPIPHMGTCCLYVIHECSEYADIWWWSFAVSEAYLGNALISSWPQGQLLMHDCNSVRGFRV